MKLEAVAIITTIIIVTVAMTTMKVMLMRQAIWMLTGLAIHGVNDLFSSLLY